MRLVGTFHNITSEHSARIQRERTVEFPYVKYHFEEQTRMFDGNLDLYIYVVPMYSWRPQSIPSKLNLDNNWSCF